MPSKQARAIGLDIAFKMKEMYAQTHELSGGRVWTIVQIAERFGVSESSARRAIMGKGAYRGVQDAVTSQTLRESAERLVLEQKLQDAIEAEKENQPDRLLARLDEGPKAEELFREWQTAPPPVLPSKEEIERMILAEREERAAKARLLGDSKPLADGSNA